MDRRDIFFVLYVFELVIVLVSAMPTSQNDWNRCKLSEERPIICPESKACCRFTEYCIYGHCESCFSEIKNATLWCMENQTINQYPHPACRYACNEILRFKNNVQMSTTPTVNTTLNDQYQQLRSEKVESNFDTKNNERVLIIVIIILIIVIIQVIFLTYYFIQKWLKNKNAQVNQQIEDLAQPNEEQLRTSINGGNIDSIDDSVQRNEEQQSPISGGGNNVYIDNLVRPVEEQQRTSGGNNDGIEDSVPPNEEQQRPISDVVNTNIIEASLQPNEEQERPSSDGENNDGIENTVLHGEAQPNPSSGIEYDGASGTTASDSPEQTGSSLKNKVITITKESLINGGVKQSVSSKKSSLQTSLSEHESNESNEPPTMSDNINFENDDNDDDDDCQQNATNPLLGPVSEVFTKQNNYKKNCKRENLKSVYACDNERAFQEQATIPLFGPTLYKKVIDLQSNKKEKNRSKVKRALSL